MSDIRKILVVDDYFINIELMREMLQCLDCEVDTAENGVEAMKRYQETKYDMIFMDIQMPEMDGFEATKRIREAEAGGKPHTPVIAVTASAMANDRQKCLDMGLDDYVSKPFQIADLEKVLNKYLDV